ncbi:MAG: acyl carrier protein [Deltaproteobacteria bacterium]|nr:MAG: acyl carrier protein [Deltaproteobacteria bacterium]
MITLEKMTEVQVKDTIQAYIVDSTVEDLSKINEKTLLFEEGIFDSMGLISLITFIEDEFDIKTEDDDLVVDNFESIAAITKYVSRRVA